MGSRDNHEEFMSGFGRGADQGRRAGPPPGSYDNYPAQGGYYHHNRPRSPPYSTQRGHGAPPQPHFAHYASQPGPGPPPPQPSQTYSAPPSKKQKPPSPTAYTPSYTYEDEEPYSIPIAPANWNNFTSSATREQLITYFVQKGIHRAIAEEEVGREFTAHAP